MTITDKLYITGKAHRLLRLLVSNIHQGQPIPGKWSIHEHTCHLAEAHSMMAHCFNIFKTITNATINPYLPKTENTDNNLPGPDVSIIKYDSERKSLINFLKSCTAINRKKNGSHPEYKKFIANIFMSHIMMHHHVHSCRIEGCWLTVTSY